MPDAGYKKAQDRFQHTNQVRTLLDHLEPNDEDITCLGEDQRDAIWKPWVAPHLEAQSKAPGTITSYLTSLKKFLKYVTSPNYDKRSMPPLHPNYLEVFNSMIPALKGWCSTVDNATQDRKVKKYLDECDELIMLEELAHVRTSKLNVEGERVLVKAGKVVFVAARDLLLFKFAIAAGTRPGPLNNAVLDDYYKAQEHEGNKIILVAKHKRSKDGLAMLGMNDELQRQMGP